MNMQHYCDSPNCSDTEHSIYVKNIPKDSDTADMSYYRLPYLEGHNEFCFPPTIGNYQTWLIFCTEFNLITSA